MRRTPWALAVITAVVLGCSRSHEPTAISVHGDWLLSFSNLSDGTLTCSVAQVPMTLEQEDFTFTGTYGEMEQSCTGLNGPYAVTLPAGELLSGTVVGPDVAFRFHRWTWYQTGFGDSNRTSLSGIAVWELHSDDGTGTTLVGTWTAVRPSLPEVAT
jgi:hypothetical protein